MLFVPIAKLARVPVVATCRQSLSDTEGGWRWLRPVHLLVDRLADVVVCVSRATRLDAIRNVGTPPRKIEVIPNGVAVPDAGGAPPNGERIGIACIANLHPYKGHAVLLEAFALAERRLGPGRLHLELVGSGVEHARLVEAGRASRRDRRWRSSARSTTSRGGSASAFPPGSRRSARTPLSVMEVHGAGTPGRRDRVGGTPELLGDGGGSWCRRETHPRWRGDRGARHRCRLRASLGSRAGRSRRRASRSISRGRSHARVVRGDRAREGSPVATGPRARTPTRSLSTRVPARPQA